MSWPLAALLAIVTICGTVSFCFLVVFAVIRQGRDD